MLNRQKNLWILCTTAATTFALANAASAVTVHDTTLDPLAGSHTVGYATSPLDAGQDPLVNQPASSFVIMDETVTLDTLTVELLASREYAFDAGQNQLLPTGNAGDDFVVRIWDNDTDRPGNLLENITVANSGSLNTVYPAFSRVTLNSLTHPQLTLGETYWVSVAIPEVDSAYSNGAWRIVTAPSTFGRSTAFSNNDNPNWIATFNSTSALSLQVTGSPIPEPATAGLLLSMLTLVGTRRTRR